jgi:hypothetical protein
MQAPASGRPCPGPIPEAAAPGSGPDPGGGPGDKSGIFRQLGCERVRETAGHPGDAPLERRDQPVLDGGRAQDGRLRLVVEEGVRIVPRRQCEMGEMGVLH